MEELQTPVEGHVKNSIPVPSVHSKPNLLNIIFVVLILLLLCSTGYLLFENQRLGRALQAVPRQEQPESVIPTDTPEPPTSSSPMKPEIQEFIQAGCISYFDGCNSCSVDDTGQSACTIMACEQMGEPKCLEFKAAN